jgi:hypothetical protein
VPSLATMPTDDPAAEAATGDEVTVGTSPVRALVDETTSIVPDAVDVLTGGLLSGDEDLLDDVRRELERARAAHRRLQREVRDATGEVGPGSPHRALGLACERLGALSVRSMVLLTRIAEAAPEARLHRRSAAVRDAVAALGATTAEAHRTAATVWVAQAGGLRTLVELDRTAGRHRLELLDALANAPTRARAAGDTVGRLFERIADTAISLGAEHATILGVTPDERRRTVRSLRELDGHRA